MHAIFIRSGEHSPLILALSRRGEGEVARTAKGDAKRASALSLLRRLTRDIAIPSIREIVTIRAPNPSGSYTAVSVSFLGHFLWVTFDAKLVPWDLLGQQKKSDSSAPKRGLALRRRQLIETPAA